MPLRLEGFCRCGAISLSVNCTIPAGRSHTTKVGLEALPISLEKPLPAVPKLNLTAWGFGSQADSGLAAVMCLAMTVE